MIDETKEWRAYADRLGFPKTQDAEKDYLQELMLYQIFNRSTNIIFRGGTAISKLYGSGRFSEDLDFILQNPTEVEVIKKLINRAIKGINLQYNANFKVEKYKNMLKYTIKIKGPLYAISNNPQSVQTLGLDMNLFERPMMDVKHMPRMPIYSDIPSYIINSLDVNELLADKIKALMERTEPVARDMYDSWILCRKYDTKPNLELVGKKMQLYGRTDNEEFSLERLKEKIEIVGKVWDSEMSRLVRNPPDYNEVKSYLLALLK
ncbi:nucleotidyltransferase toxin [Candidatus Mancarchaeum acidiphilum]|uniref:Nucleotidyltransferase toxin n=1 Tax=Candidatus Mancarchaeum acidiphilum TaxID=1920749 RepID=A0A218NMV8_9ARCH|nr:nucleotidyl transferase AbiEii/AbiGii toxin family protein [Candidatus Mancarchaeum acidiphilum]ASI13784.1 nucleotidyltransferase toxin [Candidatus Mancarchaeum acidiphilum]